MKRYPFSSKIADSFNDQTICIADCENLTIGHSLHTEVVFFHLTFLFLRIGSQHTVSVAFSALKSVQILSQTEEPVAKIW